MSKTLEEQMLEHVQYTPLGEAILKDDAIKEAQIYALEQQIEILNLVDTCTEDELYPTMDAKRQEIESQLKVLKDGS